MPRPDQPIYELPRAVERIRAAAEAARSLPFPFTLTGRAENYLWGRPDLADTIQRLQAYQDAGADVLALGAGLRPRRARRGAPHPAVRRVGRPER